MYMHIYIYVHAYVYIFMYMYKGRPEQPEPLPVRPQSSSSLKSSEMQLAGYHKVRLMEKPPRLRRLALLSGGITRSAC